MADYDIKVKIDPAGAKSGGKSVRNELKSVETSADRLRKTIVNTFSVVAIGAGLTSVIRTMASFSQEMSTVRAITQSTGNQFETLRNIAKDLGATTRYSATQAAQGETELAKAGLSVQEIVSTLPNTLNLAQAANIDLATSSGIAVNALRTFNIEASDSSHVIDVLGKASISANTTVPNLAEALKYVGSTAAGLGVPIEDVTAAIAALANKGIDASSAGTALNAIIKGIAKPTEAFSKQMENAGLSADDLSIAQHGLIAVLKKVISSGLSMEEALQGMDVRAARAFGTLKNSIPFVEQLSASLVNSDGTINEMAKTMDDNLNGALLATKSAIEALVISFGDLGAESALTAFFRGAASVIRSTANNLEEITGIVLTGAAAWAVYKLAVGGVSGKLSGLIGVLKKVSTGLLTLIATNPFAAIAAAIVIVIGLLTTFSDKIILSSDGVVTLRDYAVAAFQLISESIGPVVTMIKDKLVAALQTGRDVLANFGLTYSDVFNAAKTVINSIIGLQVGLYRSAITIFSKVRSVILRALGSEVGQRIIEVFESVVSFIIDKFKSLMSYAVKALDVIGVSIDSLWDKLNSGPKEVRFKIGPDGGIKEAEGLGTQVKNAFISGFQQDYVGDLVSAVTPAFEALQKKAREVATARIAETGTTGTGTTGTGTTGTGTTGTGTTGTRLTEAQTKALEAQKTLYESIKEPITEYTETFAAANALLDQGKISLSEYNNVLKSTDLGSSLEELKVDLMPESESALSELETTLQTRLDLINQFQEAKLVSEEEALSLSLEANRAYNDAVLEAETTRFKTQLEAGESAFSSLTELAEDYYGDQSYIYKSLFSATKAFAIAETTIAIVQGIANSAKLGWPANLTAIASTVSQTATLISQIQSTSLEGLQNGGDFRVGGSGGVDSQLVAFRATPNETVSVKTPGQQAAAASTTQSQSEPQSISIVNVDDPGKLEDFMATPKGSKAVINIIKKNPSTIKSIVG